MVPWRSRWAPVIAPVVYADGHADAMNVYVYMTMVRPGLFLQREGPGSEPGSCLLCPLGVLQCRASLVHKDKG